MFSWLTGNNKIPPPPEPNQSVAEAIRKKKYYPTCHPEDFNRSIVKQARKIRIPRQKHFIFMTFLQEEIKQEYKRREFQKFKQELIATAIFFKKRVKETYAYQVLHECRLIFVHRQLLALFEVEEVEDNMEAEDMQVEVDEDMESTTSEEYVFPKVKTDAICERNESLEEMFGDSDDFGSSEEYVFPKLKCEKVSCESLEASWNDNSLFGDIEVTREHTAITIETGNSGYDRSADEEFFGSFLVEPFEQTYEQPFEKDLTSNFKDFMEFTSLLNNSEKSYSDEPVRSILNNRMDNVKFGESVFEITQKGLFEGVSTETTLTEKDMKNLSDALPDWAVWGDNLEDVPICEMFSEPEDRFCEDDREIYEDCFDIENQRASRIDKRSRDQKEKNEEQERKLEKQLEKQIKKQKKMNEINQEKVTDNKVKPTQIKKKEKIDSRKELEKEQMKARREHPEGYLDITLGSMFSGKSTWQTLKLTRMADQRFKCLYINNIKDVRKTESFDDCVTTHNSTYSSLSSKIDRVKVKELHDVDVSNYDYIAVDEFQFFESDDTVETVLSWVQKGKYVLVASLDGDAYRRKFGKVLELIPDANEVRKITAYCDICRDTFGELKQAPFTARMTDDTTAELVGGRDIYKAMCRSCHNFHLGITQ